MDSLKVKLLNFFSEIKFEEESHTYTLGNKKLPSVSKLIEHFVDKPDFDALCGTKAAKLGIPKAELQAQWDETTRVALEQGNKTHNYAENIENRNPKAKIEEAVLNFWRTVPPYYNRVVRELRMYHKRYMFSGTCDFILFNERTNTFIIGDYKTNKNLHKNFRDKRLKYPFFHLQDSPINKYQLQLSFYQILLEQFGIPVSERWVIWVDQSGNFQRFITHDYTPELTDYLNTTLQ